MFCAGLSAAIPYSSKGDLEAAPLNIFGGKMSLVYGNGASWTSLQYRGNLQTIVTGFLAMLRETKSRLELSVRTQ